MSRSRDVIISVIGGFVITLLIGVISIYYGIYNTPPSSSGGPNGSVVWGGYPLVSIGLRLGGNSSWVVNWTGLISDIVIWSFVAGLLLYFIKYERKPKVNTSKK